MEVFEATYYPEKFNVNGLLYRTDTNLLYKNTGTQDAPVFNNIVPSLSTETGDGSDGNVIISSDTTLTESKNYSHLTINSGVTLKSDGPIMFIRVQGTLTNNGTISMSNKMTNPIQHGYPINQNSSPGGTGGNALAPGAASNRIGIAGEILDTVNILDVPVTLKHSSSVLALIPLNTRGANGGNGGQYNTYLGGLGGSGGAGGGIIIVIANAIINNGLISANGENGGNGGTPAFLAGGGGSGCGGSGGIICLFYDDSKTGSGTITVTAGTAGAVGIGGAGVNGSGSGFNGTVGVAGSAGQLIEKIF